MAGNPNDTSKESGLLKYVPRNIGPRNVEWLGSGICVIRKIGNLYKRE